MPDQTIPGPGNYDIKLNKSNSYSYMFNSKTPNVNDGSDQKEHYA